MWHLQALSSALGRRIRSVYPASRPEIRQHLDLSIEGRTCDRSLPALHIMWTRSGPLSAHALLNFKANHFVPLISRAEWNTATIEGKNKKIKIYYVLT